MRKEDFFFEEKDDAGREVRRGRRARARAPPPPGPVPPADHARAHVRADRHTQHTPILRHAHTHATSGGSPHPNNLHPPPPRGARSRALPFSATPTAPFSLTPPPS
jgi:hypothetical protein